MTICKTLSLALIALLFGACAGANAARSTATSTDATHPKAMDVDPRYEPDLQQLRP